MSGALTRFLAVALVATACTSDPAVTTTRSPVPVPTITTTVPEGPTTTRVIGGAVPLPAAPFDPLGASIAEIQQAMTDGHITSVALVDFYLARIAAYDEREPALKAILTINPEARAIAAALDAERVERGPRGPLHGIPILLKDNINTADLPTTAGSRSLEGFVPASDAFQVARLREAGAIILGKTNLHEFARDITTISSLGGQTRNPYDPARNPGGSSGGTGAAIAAEFASVGWGSDTCGSIRIPAAHNHLYGIRPTIGLSSRSGVIPLSFSEDTVGPLATHVIDLAIALQVTVGEDRDDSSTIATDIDFLGAVDPDGLEGRRIGVLDVLFDGAHPDTDRQVREALKLMAMHGAEVVPVTIPDLNALRGSATAIFLREFRTAIDAYLAAEPNAPYKSLAEIVASGEYHPSLHDRLHRALVQRIDDVAYRDAVRRRELVADTVEEFMDAHDLDALAYPTIRQPAALIGAPQSGNNCGTASVGGLPAIVLPAGFTDRGLPVGIELMGRTFSEATLIAIAAGYEAHAPGRTPPRFTPAVVEEQTAYR